MNIALESLAEFLVKAKQITYASGGSNSSYTVPPLFKDSHQLEYTIDDLHYEDVYFGQSHFAGQEVVFFKDKCIWSMCYSGGWTDLLTDKNEILSIASVLQASLRQVPSEIPFRGPKFLNLTPYTYNNHVIGDIRLFQGIEDIQRDNIILYKLSYSGGLID